MGEFSTVSDHRYCQHFTLTPALSLKGEGELKDLVTDTGQSLRDGFRAHCSIRKL